MKKYILKLVLLLVVLTPSINAVADIPTWLVGSWTDGELVVEITSSQHIRIYENKILIKEGSFSCWNDFLDITWSKDLKPSNEYSFIMNSFSGGSYLAYEGGSNLQKLPKNLDTQSENKQQKDYYGEINSSDVIEYSARYWKDISWAYGEWRIPANHISGKTYAVKITPLHYQATTECRDSTIIFSELPKTRYKVMEGHHIALGTVVYIDNLYLDLTSKRLYLSNHDNKIYLEQTVEYTTTTVKVIFWIIAIIIGIVVLGALFILVRMLIRLLISCVRKITDWVRNCWKKIKTLFYSSFKKSHSTAKTQLKNVTQSTTLTVNESQKELELEGKCRKLSKIHWLFIIGGYITLFWSISIGILLLLVTIIYISLQKFSPVKADRIIVSLRNVTQYLIERPLLKRVLLGILIGVLIYRFISVTIGLSTIIFFIFYLICSKYSPKTSIKVDEILSHIGNRICMFWEKPYAKTVLWSILIIFPLLNSTPSQSIISVATPNVEQALGITPEREELDESDFPTFRSPSDVFAFLSGHTFRDDNGNRLVIKSNSLYMNGRALTGAVRVEDFSVDEATLKAHSPFTNSGFEIWLVKTSSSYIVKVISLPSYSDVEEFYMID